MGRPLNKRFFDGVGNDIKPTLFIDPVTTTYTILKQVSARRYKVTDGSSTLIGTLVPTATVLGEIQIKVATTGESVVKLTAHNAVITDDDGATTSQISWSGVSAGGDIVKLT